MMMASSNVFCLDNKPPLSFHSHQLPITGDDTRLPGVGGGEKISDMGEGGKKKPKTSLRCLPCAPATTGCKIFFVHVEEGHWMIIHKKNTHFLPKKKVSVHFCLCEYFF